MKGLDKLARPFDVSLQIGDRALEQLSDRWLANDQDGGGSPARTVGELLDALQPGLTTSPAIDALQLTSSATRTFHGRWGETASNSPFAPAERLTSTSIEVSSSALVGTLCRRRWRCPSIFLPAARLDTLQTDALYQGFGPEGIGVGLAIEKLVAVAIGASLDVEDVVLPAGKDAADFNAHISSLGHFLGSPPFKLFELDRRGLTMEAVGLTYRYLDALGGVSEASGAEIQKAHAGALPPTSQALLAWIWLVRKIRGTGSSAILDTGPWHLADLIPSTPPSKLGFSQQDWDDVTSELRTLLESTLQAPQLIYSPAGARDFRIEQGQLPFALLNLVWLSPPLLLSTWRLGPTQLAPPSGVAIQPQLLGIALDGRSRVRSVEAGVRGDFVFTGADILANVIHDALDQNLPKVDTLAGQQIRNAAPIIAQVAATAALPERATARRMLEPMVQRLQLTSTQADAILAASAATGSGAGPTESLAGVIRLALSPFFLAAIAELAVDVGIGLSVPLQNVRTSMHQELTKFRSVADKVASANWFVDEFLYEQEVRPVLSALIGALATQQATFLAVAAANLDLNIVNSGPSGAVIRATLTALDGKLRIGVEANLSPVMDVEALTSAIGAPPAIVQLSLIDVQLHVGSLGQLDVLAIADAVHEAAQQSAKLIQSLKAFFGELIDDIGDQFEKAIAAITLSPAPAASTPQPQPSAPSSPSPSQRVAIALGVAAARANVVMRLVLRRFLLLLPVTEIRWRGGSSLIVDAHVTVPAVQLVASGSALPTPTTTPWPVAADATFAPLVETLLPGVGPNAMSTLGTSVRVEMLERFELEFESA